MPPSKMPPPPPGGKERRESVRYDLMAQVEVKAGGDVIVLPVGNISAGGLSLTLDRMDGGRRAFRVGEVVNVFLALDDELTLSMDAEVMRIELGGLNRPPGVGLMWQSQSSEAVAALSRILERLKAG